MRVRVQAAGAHFRDRQAQPRDQALGLRQLRVGHGLEIGLLQPLALGMGERRVDLDIGWCLMLVARALARGERLLQPVAQLWLGLLGIALDAGGEQRQRTLEQARIAPEHMKGLVEQLELLAAPEEQAGERPVEVVALAQAGDLQRPQCIDHAVGADRHARGPQHAGEMHHVVGEVMAGRRRLEGAGVPRVAQTALASPDFTSASRRAASLPWTRAMSS